MAKKGLYARGELVVWTDPTEAPFETKVVEYICRHERSNEWAVIKLLWRPHSQHVVPFAQLSKHPDNL